MVITVDSKPFVGRPVSRRRSRISFLLSMIAIVAAAVVFAIGPSTAQVADQEAITKLLHGMFDRQDSHLTIAPIVISGDYSVAGWTQGEMGGRALLRKKDQQWTLIVCAGDEIKSAHALMTAGMPNKDAATIERDLAAAESALPQQQVAMFSRFQGIMMMDGSGGDSHHDHNANH